ncbi:hypothetical protein HUJ05_010105, partial [Dendroctonus ponderosae]
PLGTFISIGNMNNFSVLVTKMAKIIIFLLWLMVLILVAFAVATFCAGFYIILLPLTVCIEDLKRTAI